MIRRLKTLALGLGISLMLGSASIGFAQHENHAEPAKAETKTEKKDCCADKTEAAAKKEKDHCAMPADKGACPMKPEEMPASCPMSKAAKDKATAKDKEASEVKELGNANCPITGEKVGSMQKGAHVDYEGTRVGLCCSGCSKKFLKDPEAGLKKAKESVPKES